MRLISRILLSALAYVVGSYEMFLREELLPPMVQLRTSPRFFTGHPQYSWLNRLHCIGIGEYKPADRFVTYDVNAVR